MLTLIILSLILSATAFFLALKGVLGLKAKADAVAVAADIAKVATTIKTDASKL